MGRALMNHRAGDLVDVHAPSGVLAVKILAVH
jgi:transcription elongation GreA/GreB family factor